MPLASRSSKRGKNVVTHHRGDFDGNPLARGYFENSVLTSQRVNSTGVRDHAHAALLQIGQHPRDHLHKVARIAGLGVARTLLLEDRTW